MPSISSTTDIWKAFARLAPGGFAAYHQKTNRHPGSNDGRPPGPQMTGNVVLTHIVEAIMTTQGAKALLTTYLSHAVSRRGALFPAISPEPPTHA